MASTMANCSYVSAAADGPDTYCPSCQEVITPGHMVQQGCSCQLFSCDDFLLTWAKSRRQLNPPGLPTCFQCMETLDLSRLRPESTPVPIKPAERIIGEHGQVRARKNSMIACTDISKIVGQSAIAALDELDEEDFKANRRRGNIIRMGLVRECQEALDNQHPNFAGQATQHNTFFLESWAQVRRCL